MLFRHGPNKAFLELYSRKATERNDNSISSDATDDTIEKIRTTLVSAICIQIGSYFVLFDISG